ncbi:MAG TPA: hypothetical protein VFC84_20650 [Desulfosporosinus sp.]|nr:hypothetical protein [Desulfosporosinus sp.]
MVINLEKFKETNVKVLSGRDNGQALRKKLNLDEKDKTGEIVSVVIPDDLYSINSSYFLGLFGASIRALGESRFRERYIFKCDEIIQKNVEDGISRALKESNVLRGI